MKRKTLIPLVALLALVATGCSKERRCECVVDDADYNYNPVLIVDDGIRCSDITEMSIEEKYVDDAGHHTLRRTDVHAVHCHDQRQ